MVSVTTAVMKHHDQNSLRSQGFVQAVHHQRKSGKKLKQVRDLEAEADAEYIKESCLLACSHGWLNLPSQRIQYHQLRDGTTLPHQSVIKKMLYRIAYSFFISFLVEVAQLR